MKSKMSMGIVIMLNTGLAAQQPNLVPDPGFENLKQIPCDYMGHVSLEDYSDHWRQGSTGTADIFSNKSATTCYANPNSTHSLSFGKENPHGGDNMGMVLTSSGTGGYYREYLGSTLTKPLEPGRRYYVEMYVSLADNSAICTNNIGFLFETGEYRTERSGQRIGEPQFNWTQTVTASAGWTKVSGFFTADQAYTYFVIGNFLPEEQTKKVVHSSNYHNQCVYFIDDIVIRSAGDLKASGDSVVTIGTTARLVASGGKKYQWTDAKNPNVILGTDSVLTIRVDRKTTFRVSSEDDYIELTVDVRKQVINYITELEGRKVRKGRTVEVHNDEVKIIVHDKNEVDGDSIALYYGDSLIVEHVALTKKKQTFTIKVDKENPKQIILYAENLGSVPPNTAAMTIKDGKEETDITLGSDFKFCDSVMLVYKEKD